MTDIAREPAAATPAHTTPNAPAPLRTHAHAGWTRHVLNTGAIFTATYKGVSKLPRWLSYGLGDTGTWLAAPPADRHDQRPHRQLPRRLPRRV